MRVTQAVTFWLKGKNNARGITPDQFVKSLLATERKVQ
jgi:hypothetical protein